MDKIEKNFGKGSIMKLGDDHVEQVDVIPTGSIALNAALGVGGYPRGRIIEIYGPESSGKTTLAMIVAEQLKRPFYVLSAVSSGVKRPWPSMPLPRRRKPAG